MLLLSVRAFLDATRSPAAVQPVVPDPAYKTSQFKFLHADPLHAGRNEITRCLNGEQFKCRRIVVPNYVTFSLESRERAAINIEVSLIRNDNSPW